MENADIADTAILPAVTPAATISELTMTRSKLPFFQAAADSAVRAVYQCQPYALPKAKFALWRDMILNFDPSEMYRNG